MNEAKPYFFPINKACKFLQYLTNSIDGSYTRPPLSQAYS